MGTVFFFSCFSDECPSSDSGDDDDGDDIDDDDDGTADDDDDDTSNDDDDNDDSEEVWEDSTSGLMWQNGDDCCFRGNVAAAYCQNLKWSEYNDWRLPSISELRSLIRGCPETETGGECGVTDSCVDSGCFNFSCFGCSIREGPGSGRLYWPEELKGDGHLYWSSSDSTDSFIWMVDFYRGSVAVGGIINSCFVRCVRSIIGKEEK